MTLPKFPDTLGRFARGALLGKGGMGAVFRAHDPQLGRDVALKVLLPESEAEGDDQKRFIREIRAMAAIQDANVVRIFDFGIDEGWYYFTMELLEGRSLAGLIASKGRQSTQFVVTLGLRLAAATGAIHKAGMIHRDIKPQNVFIGEDGRVTLMDLGIVKTEGSTLLTAKGQLLGTPRYLAPEILMGSTATPESDIYQLGIVLYEAATGRCPFALGVFAEVLRQVIQGVQERPRTLCPDIPEPLDALIMDAIHHDPGKRPASALDLENRLRALEKRMNETPRTVLPVRRHSPRARPGPGPKPEPKPGPKPGLEPRAGSRPGPRQESDASHRDTPLSVLPQRAALGRAGAGAVLVILLTLVAILARSRSRNVPSPAPIMAASANTIVAPSTPRHTDSPFDRAGLPPKERMAIYERLGAISSNLEGTRVATGRLYMAETLIGDANLLIEQSRRFADDCEGAARSLEALQREIRARISTPDRASTADALLCNRQAATQLFVTALADQATILLGLSKSVNAGKGEAISVWQRVGTEMRYGPRVAAALGTFVDWNLAVLSAAAAEPGRAGSEVFGALFSLHSIAETLQGGLARSDSLISPVRRLKTRLMRLEGPAGAPLGHVALALWEQAAARTRIRSANSAILVDLQRLQTLMPGAAGSLEPFKRLLHEKRSQLPQPGLAR